MAGRMNEGFAAPSPVHTHSRRSTVSDGYYADRRSDYNSFGPAPATCRPGAVSLCHETVRMWWSRVGPMFAGAVHRKRVNHVPSYSRCGWHLDETGKKLTGELVCLLRAVDHEGGVLESYVAKTRDKAEALNFTHEPLKRYGSLDAITTPGLRSCRAAMSALGELEEQAAGR